MSKIIQALETMATDASLVNEENITTFLTTAEITTEQQQAITEKNAEQLAETVGDLPKIISFSQVLPEEEGDEQTEDENDSESANSLLVSSF